jgi:predicted acetyltransferase
MINKVKLRAPADDQLPARLSNPRCKQEIVPYFMGRIVDAAAFMGQYSFTPTGETYSVRLTVEDQHAPWNDGSFIVTIGQDGRAAVKREEEGDGQAGTGLELACGIQALSSMMIGYMRPRFAGEIGRLSGSAEAVALWERLLPPQRTYLMDYF